MQGGGTVQGYIKDYRQELESDIWLMPPLYHRTWQWLKYIVNHADNEIPMRDGSKMLIKRGQHLTSIRDIAKGIGWFEGRKKKEPNPKTIDSILKWMQLSNMISIERGQSNREYTLVTLIKYEDYQKFESKGNSKVTPDGEGRERQADINNNDKELLKNENNFIKTTTADAYESVGDIYLKVFKTISMSGLMTGLIKKIKDKGHSDDFLKELMLEAGESSGGVPNIRFIESIYQSWEEKNINSREESKEDKKRRTNNVHSFKYKNPNQKPSLPIISDAPKSEPISDERRAEMRKRAEMLDDEVSNR